MFRDQGCGAKEHKELKLTLNKLRTSGRTTGIAMANDTIDRDREGNKRKELGGKIVSLFGHTNIEKSIGNSL